MRSRTATRRGTMAVAALTVLVLGMASAAWACSQKASASAAGGQTSGPPGTKITVTGKDFEAGPIEVRWDSSTGPVLANASGPSFSVPVTIPGNAPAGVHYILAIQPVTKGSGTFAFEVTAPATKTSSSNTGDTSEGNTSTSAAAADEEETSGQGTSTGTNTSSDGTNTSNTSSGTGTNTNTGSSTGTNTGTSTASTGTGGQSSQAGTGTQAAASATAAPATANAPRPTKSASANAPAVIAPTGQVVFGGSSAAPADEVAAVSSATMVSGDTWSGFAASTKPSLLSDPIGAPSSSDSGNGPALAIGLLAAGMMAMFAGFGVAEMSRKRSLAVAKKH